MAQEVVLRALEEVDDIADYPAVEVLVLGFADSGVNMEAQVWHPAAELIAKRTVSEAAIVIRETLAENDITIPYPQLVVRSPDR